MSGTAEQNSRSVSARHTPGPMPAKLRDPQTAMHAVLKITEVQRLIFATLPMPTNAIAARVCHAWHDTALDTLWRTIDSPRSFLATIPNFSLTQAGSYGLKGYISDDVWRRFAHYTSRTRSLSNGGEMKPSWTSMLEDFAIMRPVTILPNLIKLDWDAESNRALENGIMFLLPTVTNFCLTASTQVADECLEAFLSLLPSRLPMLETFALKFLAKTTANGAFPTIFKRFMQLQNLTICLDIVSSELWSALATLPVLSTIVLLPSRSAPSFPVAGFPALHTLSVTALCQHAKRLIDTNSQGQQLKSLTIRDRSMKMAPNEDLANLTCSIASHCSHLEQLRLDTIDSPRANADPYTMAHIHAISSLSGLTSLALGTTKVLGLSDHDLEALVCGLPNLETFALHPLTCHGTSNLTLGCLSHLARHCKFLQKITILVNTSLGFPSPPIAKQFNRYTTLNMHFSPVDVEQTSEIVEFLSAICPPGMKIIGGLRVMYEESFADMSLDARGLWKKWIEVGRLVRVVHDHGGGIQRRVSDLERKLEEAQRRIDELMGQGGSGGGKGGSPTGETTRVPSASCSVSRSGSGAPITREDDGEGDESMILDRGSSIDVDGGGILKKEERGSAEWESTGDILEVF